MSAPRLQEGRVYRTEYFRRFDKNPTRYVSRLVKRGDLRPLRKGLFYVPRASLFGEAPPSEDALLRAFFRGEPYLRTGPSVWNALGLGTTGVEATPLVYNTTRTGELDVGGRRFELRRVRFPRDPDPEYFVVDLLENSERAGTDRETVERALAQSVANGRFNPERLLSRAEQYGIRATVQRVRGIVERQTSEKA